MSISLEKLKQIIDGLEALELQKTEIVEEIRGAMAEAKGDGFDPKVLRQVLKIRKMKPEDLSEQEELLQLYLSALGQ